MPIQMGMCLRVPVFMWVIMSFHLRIFSGLKWCQTHTHSATVQQSLCQLTSQFTDKSLAFTNNWQTHFSEGLREAQKFTGLTKLSTVTEFFFFQFTFKVFIYHWDLHSSKCNSEVRRSSYKANKKIPWLMLWSFSKLKCFSNIWKGSQSLSKSTSKYLVYYQVFEVEVRRL